MHFVEQLLKWYPGGHPKTHYDKDIYKIKAIIRSSAVNIFISKVVWCITKSMDTCIIIHFCTRNYTVGEFQGLPGNTGAG